MLELAILGLLKERSMHGYQLSKRLTDSLGGFWRVSYGSLYPTLRRLERDGAVERVDGELEVAVGADLAALPTALDVAVAVPLAVVAGLAGGAAAVRIARLLEPHESTRPV